MNALPLLAIDNVQVLRDGAAAQYGSDAIAGVINIAVEKAPGLRSRGGLRPVQRRRRQELPGFPAYCGFALGDQGVLGHHRRVPRPRAFQPRRGRQPAHHRRHTKPQTPRFMPMASCPPAAQASSTSPRVRSSARPRRPRSRAAALARDDIPSRNSAAMYPERLRALHQRRDRRPLRHPRPSPGSRRLERSISRRPTATTGCATTSTNTLNASIANQDLLNGGTGISPTRFDAGGFAFSQATTNFDFTRFYEGVAKGMNVAFGLEYRRENYKIFAGEPGSYIDADGVGIGGNAGSQGFPGFQPSDATSKTRSNRAAYIDVETDVSNAAEASGRAAPRTLWRLRLHHERQARRGLQAQPATAAARHRSARASARLRCSRSISRPPSPTSSTASRSTWCWRPTAARSPMQRASRS